MQLVTFSRFFRKCRILPVTYFSFSSKTRKWVQCHCFTLLVSPGTELWLWQNCPIFSKYPCGLLLPDTLKKWFWMNPHICKLYITNIFIYIHKYILYNPKTIFHGCYPFWLSWYHRKVLQLYLLNISLALKHEIWDSPKI